MTVCESVKDGNVSDVSGATIEMVLDVTSKLGELNSVVTSKLGEFNYDVTSKLGELNNIWTSKTIMVCTRNVNNRYHKEKQCCSAGCIIAAINAIGIMSWHFCILGYSTIDNTHYLWANHGH